MTKPTTDFREKIGTILVKWHMPTRQAAISEIKTAVSELVKECLGADEPKILIHDDGSEWTNIEGIAINERLAEIRQRFAERGIEIK